MKTVVITGASRGIGAAAAELFAQNGCQTVLCYHTGQNEAESLADRLRKAGGTALAVQADVSDTESVTHAVALISEQFGHIDILVNNAGIAEQKLFTDISDADWSRMIEVNLGGVFRFCRAVLPTMIRQKSGAIVNISSIWGLVGASCEVHYSAAKAGIIGLTKALAKETGPSGIRVNCVAPGVVDTRMNQNLTPEDLRMLADETPLERIGRPEEIARTIYFLASEQSGFITGQVISPNGGFVIY